ncbi:uncharacterized protein [Venturia canescens]|uniref:uncharacterized protein n=1 Tax=Venturia canescens TaxID=32260 RepID=UPI001C9C98F3|nr:uncharacterized protein LOC122407735 [Venturia canescens]
MSAAIACRRFSGTHSYDRIAALLTEIHSTFDLDSEKVLAVVTDNGSNFIKAFKVFGVNMPDDFFYAGLTRGNAGGSTNEDENSASDLDYETIAEDTATYENIPDDDHQNFELPNHFRCASHTLNLIATQDAVKGIKCSEPLSASHSEVMDRCTELWRLTRSPKKYEILKEALEVALLRPVVVRWNSLYDSFVQLISLKDKLLAVSVIIGICYPLRENDFKYIENYVKCLRPIAEALDKLQGEEFGYYGYVLPTLITTTRKLKMLTEKPSMYSYLPLIQALITGLETRFSNFFQIEKEGEYAAIAAISHLLFKARWLGFFPNNIQEKVRTVVINAAQHELGADVLSPHPEVEEDSDFFDFGPTSVTFGRSSMVFRNEDPEVQIIQFTKEHSTDLILLDSYPLVKKLFIRYNTPLPSSDPVERLFSFATMMDLPKYNRLSDINFERRVLSVANAKLF